MLTSEAGLGSGKIVEVNDRVLGWVQSSRFLLFCFDIDFYFVKNWT
jgi:hypothetical protein